MFKKNVNKKQKRVDLDVRPHLLFKNYDYSSNIEPSNTSPSFAAEDKSSASGGLYYGKMDKFKSVEEFLKKKRKKKKQANLFEFSKLFIKLAFYVLDEIDFKEIREISDYAIGDGKDTITSLINDLNDYIVILSNYLEGDPILNNFDNIYDVFQSLIWPNTDIDFYDFVKVFILRLHDNTEIFDELFNKIFIIKYHIDFSNLFKQIIDPVWSQLTLDNKNIESIIINTLELLKAKIQDLLSELEKIKFKLINFKSNVQHIDFEHINVDSYVLEHLNLFKEIIIDYQDMFAGDQESVGKLEEIKNKLEYLISFLQNRNQDKLLTESDESHFREIEDLGPYDEEDLEQEGIVEEFNERKKKREAGDLERLWYETYE